MSKHYDSTVHYHIGCDFANQYVEAVAFKQENQHVWDVYFSFAEHGLPTPHTLSESPDDDVFGHLIYSVQTADLVYEEASSELKNWLQMHV